MDQVLCGMFSHLATSSLDRLASWFDSSSGRRLLSEQAPVISECARRFHGDTLLWAGCHTDLTDTVRGCMVRHRFFLEPFGAAFEDGSAFGGELSHFRADLHELPIPNNTLDAAVLHHVLETAEDARTAIREVSRALAPGGRLLIVSFNPWSLWGVRGAYARLFKDSFSGLRFVSSRRLLDWLTVLGFELQQEVKYLAYDLPFPTRSPFSRKGDGKGEGKGDEGDGTDQEADSDQDADLSIWRRLGLLAAGRGLPFGGVYVISAVKQVTAIRPDWSESKVRGRKLAPAAYPKLSARIAHLPVRTPPQRLEDSG